MTKFVALLLIFTQVAFAGLPPTTIQGQTDASPKTKFAFQTPHNQSTDLGGIKALIETGNQNILPNPGFEASSSGWTVSAGVQSLDLGATNISTGKKAFKWVPAAASDTASSAQVAIPNGYYGTNGLFSCFVKTSGLLHKLQLVDGSGNVIVDSGAIATAANGLKIGIPFIFPSSGSVAPRILAGDTNAIYLDDCSVEPNQKIGAIAESKYLGKVVLSGCSNQPYAPGGGFSNFPLNSGCSYAVTGVLQAPATQVPGFILPFQGPGTYTIKAQGDIEVNSGVGVWRFSDGTNVSPNTYRGESGATDVYFGEYTGDITYTSAPSAPITIQMQASTNQCLYDARGTNYLTFQVWFTPSMASQAVLPELQAIGWSGYTTGCATDPVVTNAALADFNLPAGCSLTQSQNTNMGTVSLGSTAASITFTPKKTGTYRVSARVNGYPSNLGVPTLALTDGSNTVLDSMSGTSGAAQILQPTLSQRVEITSLAAVTFKLRGSSTAGDSLNLYGGASGRFVVWTIEDISQNTPAPFVVGQVSSNTSGQIRIEAAFITNNGTVAIGYQSGSWLSGVSRSATGIVTGTINTGMFSASPVCTVNLRFASTTREYMHINVTSPTSFTTYSTNVNGVDGDYDFYIICVGPK